MVKLRSASAALLLVLGAAPVLAPPARAAAVISGTLSGVVRDDLGRALEGAEILVLAPEGSAGGALVRAVTDATGRFLVGALAPGVYRVAAIKSGYVAALGRVNTTLRSSVDLVLRPVPKTGEPGSDKVQSDLSWSLRVPPRSILREVEAEALLAAHEPVQAAQTRLGVGDSLRGQVDHIVAMGFLHQDAGGKSSGIEGNETRMRFGGNLGQRGAIQVEGRRGTFDSSSNPSVPLMVSRAASDLDVDLSYDTSNDASLGMRAFYSAGALEVGDGPGLPGGGARQGQRSWGYEGRWNKQVDGASRVAVQVGIHDANLEMTPTAAASWDRELRDASNRAIGAEGQYETFVGDGHLIRFGMRAQLLNLAAPSARLGRPSGTFALDGTTGWSMLMDAGDEWTIAAPVAVTYGLAIRQGFAGPFTTTATPRVGATVSTGRLRARAEITYLATAQLGSEPAAEPARETRSPYGYTVEMEAPITRTATVRGTASYVPLRANVWGGVGEARDLQDLYVTDGFASDRFVALGLERAAGNATVSFRLARGHAEGALAPALDRDVPVVVLSDRALTYESVRLGAHASRSGSTVSVEYRAMDGYAAVNGIAGKPLRTVELEFTQELVRLAGGRASCRLLLAARSAVGSTSESTGIDPTEAHRFAALYQRLGAGVSLAF